MFITTCEEDLVQFYSSTRFQGNSCLASRSMMPSQPWALHVSVFRRFGMELRFGTYEQKRTTEDKIMRGFNLFIYSMIFLECQLCFWFSRGCEAVAEAPVESVPCLQSTPYTIVNRGIVVVNFHSYLCLCHSHARAIDAEPEPFAGYEWLCEHRVRFYRVGLRPRWPAFATWWLWNLWVAGSWRMFWHQTPDTRVAISVYLYITVYHVKTYRISF